MVVLDTSVIIDHLRQEGSGDTLLLQLAQEYPAQELAISPITVQELYEGRSTRERDREDYLLATIAPLRQLPYTYDTAQLAGEIARDVRSPIEFADAAVAATALLNDARLATLNTKDFARVPELQLL